MPASQRFGFMQKYSTDEYSMEMGRAVDMWSECALLVACVAEANKLWSKIKAGNGILPLTKSSVMRAVRAKISPLLASPGEYFIPPSLGYYNPLVPRQTVPLSAAALTQVQEIIETSFGQLGQPMDNFSATGRRNFQIVDLADSQAVMARVVAEIAILLKKALKTVNSELDDVVPYGHKGCKEWIFGITGIGKRDASGGALDELEDS